MIPPVLPPKAPGDSFGSGFGIAVLCQLTLILAGTCMVFSSLSFAPFGVPLFGGWGLLQWIALVPLYLRRRGTRRPLAAKGILVAGCIGFLLNAGCDFIGLMSFHVG
jgi:hypothetical protein